MSIEKEQKSETVKTDTAAIPTEEEVLAQNKDSKPRKPALSKREIMEEMSRARFPWEE